MECENYKISVIVPIYNAEKYLKRCIDSILSQTHKNLEIILVNDCSTDNSLKICEQFKKEDKRIVLIDNERNMGQASSRNIGLKIASGDYITFVDNDDVIDKDMYKILINDAIKYKTKVTGCACLLVFENGDTINNYKNDNSELKESDKLIKRMLMHSDNAWGTVWNKIFSKDLKDYLVFPNGKELEDYYVLINLYTKVDKAYFNCKPMYFWYQRRNSQSKRGYHKNINTLIDVSIEIRELLENKGFERELNFFEFVNRYNVITATFKSKNKELYKSLKDEIIEIEKLNRSVLKIRNSNRNIKKMILKIKLLKLILLFYK